MSAAATASEVKRALVDLASARYRPAGRFAYHFARGKLGGDPAFMALLRRGMLSQAKLVLDLGCGQGLLAAWLDSARELARQGRWPGDWPAAPAAAVRGIELMASDVERARTALGAHATFAQGDIRYAEFGQPDVVVILDVLHYIDYEAQDDVLRRVRAAIGSGGRLLLRVGDQSAGLPFRFSNWVDRIVFFCRGHGVATLYCRPLAGWMSALEAVGFSVQAAPMSDGTPFANVLLVGQAMRQ